MPTRRPATIMERTTFVGVSQLARETGFSQGHVSKLLARGWTEDGIRGRAKVGAFRRKIRAMRLASRRRVERRRR